ncbi:MAG: acetylornithine deacetylase [Sulfobacillus benefaciens]|uniref:Probable succinyl-diaminopimelate desuccinylase n=1 Tax=Sulfobacillus benefaciens TaxID=453960 RepID=A0A2T2X8U4_9FIRM|nr:MAG: acetylornithine deacetylase [Sulfobacillus benefaciens]
MVTDEAIKLLVDLVQSDSTNPPGTEERAAHHVAEYLTRHDVAVKWQEVSSGRQNLLACLNGEASRQRPALLFCGHLDTVPIGSQQWAHEPFGAQIDDGVLFGRGASDMKSGVAAMAVMMARLRQTYGSHSLPIQLLLTVGEEVDSIGAERYLEQYGVDGVGGIVIGEPTNGQIGIGHKGAYWMEMQCFGRTAHGSMPQLGVNAIDQILEALNLLGQIRENLPSDSDAVLGDSTIAITQIGGGIQTNVIPDQAFFRADMRFGTPEQQKRVLDAWQRALDLHQQQHEEFRYQWHPLLNRSPLFTEPSHPLIQKAQALCNVDANSWRTVSYYTDGSVLAAPTNIPTLIYGPGDDRLAHQPDESVPLSSFLECIDFYHDLAKSYAHGDWDLN